MGLLILIVMRSVLAVFLIVLGLSQGRGTPAANNEHISTEDIESGVVKALLAERHRRHSSKTDYIELIEPLQPW